MKQHTISIRLNCAEKKQLEILTKEKKQSFSECIRSLLMPSMSSQYSNQIIAIPPSSSNMSVICFKLPINQKEYLQKEITRIGISSLSQYIRNILLSRKIVTKTDVATIKEIRAIGININQIAKHCNQNPNNVHDIGIKQTLDKYFDLLKQIETKIDS